MLKVGDKVRFKENAFKENAVFNGKEGEIIGYEPITNGFTVKCGEEKLKIASTVLNTSIDKGYQPKHAKEMVNHPSHYNKGIETIDYIESWGMNFNVGNVVKYVTRSPYKGNELEDLKKARFYLDREIVRLEKEND